MSRRKAPRVLRTRPSLFRPKGLRLEWLEDRLVPADLTLTLADSSLVEGFGTTATLTRTGDLSQPLAVSLDASDLSEVTLPGSAVVPAGQASVTFLVETVDDTDADGVRSVNLLAWVPNEPGTAYAALSVLDNESPPTAGPDAYDANEDWTFSTYPYYGGVLSNDASFNGALTASLVSGPAHGTLALNPDGHFTYTPEPNYFGTDSFTYRATDPAGLSGEAAVTLYVWGMDDPLQLSDPGPQTTAEDTPLTFSAALGNAFTIADIDNPPVMVSLLANGGDGVLTLRSTAGLEFPYPDSVNNSHSITFIADTPAEANAALEGLVLSPKPNLNGPVTLYIQVRDQIAGMYSDVYAFVPITVTPVNDVPVAAGDAYDAYEDTTLISSGFGSSVLGNDTDVDWDPLSAVLVSGPAHGVVTLNPNGSFSYTPALNYYGPDKFTYRAADAASQSNVATVSLTVWGMDDPIRVTAPGQQATAEDVPLTFSAATGNAITVADPESPRVMVSLLANGGDGVLTLRSTAGLEFPYPDSVNNSPSITFYADDPAEANAALNGLVFTPNANFNGQTSLSVLVRDLTLAYPPFDDFTSVLINVAPVNDAPVAANDSFDWYEDSPLYGYGLLFNDTDVDRDPLTAVLVSGPSHGTLTLDPYGNFTYTPTLNYNGPDSFTYRVSDGTAQSNVATASLTIWPMDDPVQVTVPGPQSTAEDTPLTFSAANGNAITVTDPESPRLFVQVATYGILTLRDTTGLEFYYPEIVNNAPSLYFYVDSPAELNAALEGLVVTPYPNETVPITLTVAVRDDSFASYPDFAWGEVPITVTPVDDAPVALPDAYTVEAGEPLVTTTGGGGAGPGVLSNDTDVDGDVLSAVLVSGPGHGTLTLNPDGSFTYTAEATYTGTDTFTYRASDGLLLSGPATVTITVTPRNLPPVSAGDAYAVDEDGSLTVAAPGFLGNDADPEGQPLTATLAVGQAHGTLVFRSDGGFTYTPAANYHGPDGFWYRAFDCVRYGELTYVALTVTPVNDAPVAAGNSYALDEDTTLTVPAAGVLGNDTDLDGDALAAAVVTGPSHGALTLNADGGFTYTPAANYAGPDSFTYRASDPAGAGSVATVSLTVRPVADAPVALDDAYTATEDAPFSVVVPGFNSLTMVSDTGDYIGQGQTWNYGSGASYSAYYAYPSNPSSNNAITVKVTSGSDWWYLDFWAPNNARFVPGTTYTGATRFPFNSSSVPGMDVSGNGRGSNTLTGWFRVDEVAYGPAGEILVFAVTFEQHSEGRTPALRGTVRYNAGATAAGGVLLNDSDADGNPLTAVLVEGPANGRLYFNPNGTFMYVPNPNYFGADTFRYKVSDGTAYSNVATATITVAGVNDVPVNVVPGTQTLVEDTTVTFSAANGNAIRLTDIDAGSSVIELRLSVNGFLTFPTTTGLTFITGSNGGNIITVRGTPADLNAALDGLVFRPGTNFVGNYSLQVTTSDLGNTGSGGARTDTDYVTLSITPVNDAPQNVVPLITPVTAEDTPLTFNPYVWVTDVDQTTGDYYDPVRVTVEFAAGAGTLTVTPGANVTVTGNGTGRVVLDGAIVYVNNVLRTLTFTPVANANDLTAPVQIRVTTDDLANGGPGALTDTDVFAVSVTPVNDAPQFTLAVGGVTVPMNYGNAVALLASGAVGPATATDELALQTLTYGVEVTGTTGTLTFAVGPAITPDGRLRFTPTAGTWGTATLRVWASDGFAVTPDQTLSIWVTNSAPTSGGLPSAANAEDTPTSVTLSNHFADAEDAATALTYTVVGNTNPALFGSVVVSGGVLTLSPAANASGSATLTVRATDSGGLWVESHLAVTVTPVNDAPTSTGLPPVTADEDAAPASVTLTGRFADVEDGTTGLTYAVVGSTNPGLFSYVSVSGGVLTAWLAANANGGATLTVRATDSGGLSVDVPLAVTVNPVNDAPTGGGLPAVAALEDASPATLGLTGYFTDPEDGAAGLTYAVVGNTNPGLFGSASISGGVLTLSFAANASGGATLTVRATDAGGLSVDVPLAVTVAPVNDTPTFAAGPNVTVASDAGPQTVAGWATSISRGPADEAGQALTFEVWADNPLLFAAQPAIDPTSGKLTFTPVVGASGTATVTVVLRDNGGGTDASAPATFTVTLTPPALPPGMQVIGTELVITGGAGNDSITISPASGGANGSNGAKITGTLNGQSVNKTFKQPVTSVRVSTGGGNDTVTFANAFAIPTLVDAGAGDDSVRGGAGPDLILGGDGRDTLQGYNGDDDVDGGAGDDSLVGGLGNDLLLGGAGNDTIQGGDGNDFLIGGMGADQLYGQNGHDIVVGGFAAVRDPAADSLRQVLADWDPSLGGVYVGLRARLLVTDDPASSDRLQGDAGTDWFWSWDPLDVLDLGPGEQRN